MVLNSSQHKVVTSRDQHYKRVWENSSFVSNVVWDDVNNHQKSHRVRVATVLVGGRGGRNCCIYFDSTWKSCYEWFSLVLETAAKEILLVVLFLLCNCNCQSSSCSPKCGSIKSWFASIPFSNLLKWRAISHLSIMSIGMIGKMPIPDIESLGIY
jgi:hypothetical protein